MLIKSNFPKPLKGGALSSALLAPLQDSIFTALSSGAVPFGNINITGGTIDGVVLGSNSAGPSNVTTLQSGTPDGQGYLVCFFGSHPGDSACWLPVQGQWAINGDLLVRDISDLGNLRVAVNTISSTNTNGNIILAPNGSGNISLLGPINQSTNNGNISFYTTNGLYNLITGTTINTQSGTDTTNSTQNGDITLKTGLNIPTSNITMITTGANPLITTSSVNGLKVGDTIDLTNTNSSPIVDGTYTVIATPSTTTFQITATTPVTSIGTSGNVVKHNDINLTATNNVNIPNNVALTFGTPQQNIIGNSQGEINVNTTGDLNLNVPSGDFVNLPTNVGLSLANENINLISDGTNLTMNVGSSSQGNLVVNNTETTLNGDLVVTGTTTSIQSTVTTIEDPVITLGQNFSTTINDGKDRGIEFKWFNGTKIVDGFFGFKNSTGCFTYIPDATNTNEVFTGTPGCASFGNLSATSLNVQGGTISNLGSLNVCNITCNGTFTLTATNSASFTSPIITTNGTLTSNGNLTANGSTNTINGSNFNVTSPNIALTPNIFTIGTSTSSTQFRGIDYLTPTGTGFFGYNPTSNCFTFVPNATNTGNIITGALGNACFATGNFNSINCCNITCNGTLTLTGTSAISLTSPSTTSTGTFTSNGTLVSQGNFTANGTTNTINGTNFVVTSPNASFVSDTITLGQSVTDTQSRGILYNFGSQTGFFGYNPVSNCFSFVPNTSTSTLGNACFATGNFSSINCCNITCNGMLTLTGTTGISLTSPSTTTTGTLTSTGNFTANGPINTINGTTLNVNNTTTNFGSTNVLFNDPIITINGITPPSGSSPQDSGIEFRYYSGGTAQTAFFGWDNSINAFTFLQNTTNTNEVISGTTGNATFGNTTVNNLVVNGTITGGNISTQLSTEHINPAGGSNINPTASINMTFVRTTGTGNATGTLLAAPNDGFQKMILATNIATGTTYKLSCPAGILVDAGSGTTAAKTITFAYSGQSVHLIWDNVAAVYIVVGGYACVA